MTGIEDHSPRWVPALRSLVGLLPFGRYRLMESVVRYKGNPFWAQLPESSGGAWFLCNLQDSKQRDVCLVGSFEPVERTILAWLLKSGDTFVDVGANWGYFTLVARELVGSQGRIVSVEADPRIAEVLKLNIQKNEFLNVVGLHIAVSDQAGTCVLRGFDEKLSNFGISVLDPNLQPSDGCFQVNTIGLDDLLDAQRVDSVDFLKMDIEGAEVLALQGMVRGLKAARYKRIMMELHPWAFSSFGGSLDSVLKMPHAHGYRAWWLNDSDDVNRRMLYGANMRPQDLIRPLNWSELPVGRAHILWLAPDVNLPS